MANEQDQDKEALEDKIQLLEQELALLRSRLAQKSSVDAPPRERKPEGGLIDNAWLIGFGQYLLLEPDKSNVISALTRLGERFELKDCSFWRVLGSAQKNNLKTDIPKLSCLGQWQSEPNALLRRSDWLENFWQGNPQAADRLVAGEPVVLLASDNNVIKAVTPLKAMHIYSSLLIPVVRENILEAFLVLHRGDPSGWYTRDVDRLTFIANALYNLNERRELIGQLSDRDTRFNYAIEASNDGLWDWNLTNGRIYFSRNYLRMLGYNYDELPGNIATLKDYFLYQDDVKIVMARFMEAISNREVHVNFQCRMQHQSGKILWIQSKVKFCEPDATGRPTRCVGLNTDISDFVIAREDLLAAKTQADMANKTKSEFLARMSHEIRTPMNAIIGLGYLLRDTTLDEQQKSYLGSLNSASDSLLHIINEILDFSKIDHGKIILEQSHFDLDSLFEKISRLFEISAIHKTIRIIYDIKSDVPHFLRGDAPRLSQVIGHLISNALQYSETTEVIVGVKLLEATSKHVDLEFSVTDYGVGMSAERLSKVNESLLHHVQIEDADRSRFGLGICGHLVKLMGGQMHIDSSPSRGCHVTFNVRFDNSQMGAHVVKNNTRDLKNIRALIVDDNVVARTVMATTAKNISLSVDIAETAEIAINKITQANEQEKPFHIVLMDYSMPTMNGIEAAIAIKTNKTLRYSPHIILVSAFQRDEISGADKIALYMDEFLSKPVSETRLLETLSDVISKDQRLQEISALAAETSAQDNILRDLRVLVAEDNIVNQQVVRGVLKKKGIHVVIANNGAEAVAAVNDTKEPFDIILMDLEMPEMDGIEATHIIRTRSHMPNIPIVALTAQAMRGDRERCLGSGMSAYLSKPINPELLYKTLAEQLIKPSLVRPA